MNSGKRPVGVLRGTYLESGASGVTVEILKTVGLVLLAILASLTFLPIFLNPGKITWLWLLPLIGVPVLFVLFQDAREAPSWKCTFKK